MSLKIQKLRDASLQDPPQDGTSIRRTQQLYVETKRRHNKLLKGDLAKISQADEEEIRARITAIYEDELEHAKHER